MGQEQQTLLHCRQFEPAQVGTSCFLSLGWCRLIIYSRSNSFTSVSGRSSADNFNPQEFTSILFYRSHIQIFFYIDISCFIILDEGKLNIKMEGLDCQTLEISLALLTGLIDLG